MWEQKCHTHLSLIFSTLYPGQVMQNSTNFQFNNPIVCGDEATLSVGFNCNDLGANSTCIPSLRTTKRFQQSPPTKRDGGVQCDQYNGQCRNQYQSTTSFCSSGYKKEAFHVSGYTADILCTKPCTEKEAQSCRNTVCTRSRGICERPGNGLRICIEALIECRDGVPIKMDESQCMTKWLKNGNDEGFPAFCKGRESPCLEYKDGACRLDAFAWEDYVKELEGRRYQAMTPYYPPPPGGGY